ncbi:MAG: response regulator transcription factor [Bacteroidetes bacterium]|nr:response regulator transcription factor [Bacteroidota bacterium]
MYIEKKIHEYVEAGVNGFILKDCKIEDFINAIASVAAGKEVIPCQREEIRIFKTKQSTEVTENSEEMKPVKLTKRERLVIGLIANGTDNKEIKRLLHISAFKLKNHVHDIFKKVALHSEMQS